VSTRSDRTVHLRGREARPGQHNENVLLPAQDLVDPHHHRWARDGHTPLAPEFAADAPGHRIEAIVHAEGLGGCREDGPEHLPCVVETEFVMRQRPPPARPDIAAGAVVRADLALGNAVVAALEEHQVAAGARFKGVRYVTARYASRAIHGADPTPADLLRVTRALAGARRLVRNGGWALGWPRRSLARNRRAAPRPRPLGRSPPWTPSPVGTAGHPACAPLTRCRHLRASRAGSSRLHPWLAKIVGVQARAQ